MVQNIFMNNYKPYCHPQIFTLKELIAFCAKIHGKKPAFQYHKRNTDIFVTYLQFQKDVLALGTYLFANGYRDCHIAVYGENSYEWILTHFAVTCGKNVIVPIDKDLSAREIAYLLKDSDCKAIFYSNTYADIMEALDLSISSFNMKDISILLEEGNSLLRDGYRDYLEIVPGKDDLASIVYTSGTTGKPKGVMLSHLNFCSSMYGACCNVLLEGPSLLVLPLHHTFGLVASVFAVMFYGYPIYINKSLKRLSDDFQKCKPQHLFAVPLIVETLYKTIWSKAKEQNKEKALKVLIAVSNALLKFKIDLRKQLFQFVIGAFGGNLELIVSGGAPIDEKYIQGLQSFGITVLNGYGITECGPVVAVNRNKFVVPGSVGVPLCCNQVKIADDGEVLVKGDNVMLGYYHNDAENERVFLDGWFHTGDLGKIDEYGALHITGRIKNLIILGNGENISAESIEAQIYTIPYVKEAITYGQDNTIVAELYLDESVLDAREKIYDAIQQLNQMLPQIRNIGKIIIRDTEFPKTTTKKIKRDYGG